MATSRVKLGGDAGGALVGPFVGAAVGGAAVGATVGAAVGAAVGGNMVVPVGSVVMPGSNVVVRGPSKGVHDPTVTDVEHEAALEALSTAVKFRIGVPTGNKEPLANPAVWARAKPKAQLSVTDGVANNTTAPQPPASLGTDASEGHVI